MWKKGDLPDRQERVFQCFFDNRIYYLRKIWGKNALSMSTCLDLYIFYEFKIPT